MATEKLRTSEEGRRYGSDALRLPSVGREGLDGWSVATGVEPLTRAGSAGSGVHCATLGVRGSDAGRNRFRMLAHPVAVAADVDDVAVVQQPVDEGGGHDIVSEDAAHFSKPLLEVSAMEARSWRA